MSQTPATHTSVAASTVQVPSSVGDVWVASDGMEVPFGSLSAHVCAASLHHLPPVQSVSRSQPPDGMHLPSRLHVLLRQRVSAVPAMQPLVPCRT